MPYGVSWEGGKKKVYLAHDSLLDRDVAFALIKTEGLDEAARERITREHRRWGASATTRILSPSMTTGPRLASPNLVLPLLPGGDLEGLIEKAENHQLPLERAVKITDQLCQALEYAHTKGVIHRDVKPGKFG